MASTTTSTVPEAAPTLATSSAPAGTSGKVSLYVGDLAKDVNEQQLFTHFAAIGPVSSVRLCRDNITRQSLGYAYVNYTTHEDAASALEKLNYTLIRGKPCRIMWSERNPSLRKTGTGNVFVKNLHPAITSKDLVEVFKAAGNVQTAKVATDEHGKSRGYGYVTFDSEAGVQAAISQLHGLQYMENYERLDVKPFVPRTLRTKEGEWTNCYVKNVPKDWTDEKLKEKFAPYGEITSAVIMRNATGESKGFGFVNFASNEAAEKAVAALNDTDVEDVADEKAGEGAGTVTRKLFVGKHQKKTDRMRALMKAFKERKADVTKNCNLYVKNISDEVTDDELRAKFSKYGTITSAKIMRDAAGASKGFGFVCFATAEEASKAMAELHKAFWNGRPLFVSLHQRKDERTELLQKFHDTRAQAQGPATATFRGGLGAPAPAAGAMGIPGMQGAIPAQFAHVLQNPQLLQLLLYQQMMYQQQQAGAAPGTMPMPAPGAPTGAPATGGVPTAMAPRPMTAGGPGVAAGPRPVTAAPVAAGPATGGVPGPRGMPAGQAVAPGPRNFSQAVQGLPAGGPAARTTHPGPSARPAVAIAASRPGAPGAAPRGAPMYGQAPPQQRMPQQGGYPARPGAPVGGMPPREAEHAKLLESLRTTTDPAKQRDLLGETLYPRIANLQPDKAAKITGMLLEMDVSELLHLIEDESALRARVEEAVAVLRSATAGHA